MSREAWMWLVNGLGFGAVNTGELLAAYPGGALAVGDDLGSETLDEILTMKQAEKLASTRPEDFALPLAHAESVGVLALPYDDARYPAALRSIPNPPPLLFVKGDSGLFNGQLSVGMVGSRRPSAYGVEAVREIGRGVALGGAIIVSGLAAGLDAEAHKAALSVNGPTIACIAFGHDTCYPAANKKLKEIIERYGAVVSEYPMGTAPEKPYFLQRNRLIAGLSHALVVVEARTQSGTMSTVNFASDYGRDVFAVPGSIFSELSGGTNAMLREGAYVASSAADIMSLYGIEMKEEDLALAAQAQAKDGRPEGRSAEGGLRQMTLGAPATEERQPPPREAEQGDRPVPPAGGGATTLGAISAFKQMQQPTLAAGGASAMLDERAASVSDSVEIQRGKKDVPVEIVNGKEVRPFAWDSVEHLDKKEIEKLKKAKGEATPAKKPVKPIRPTEGQNQNIVRYEPVGRVERVGGVEPVSAVPRVSPVEPVAALAGAERVGGAALALPANETVNRPAEKPAVKRESRDGFSAEQPLKPLADYIEEEEPEETKAPPPELNAANLAGKLRTLNRREGDEGESRPRRAPRREPPDTRQTPAVLESFSAQALRASQEFREPDPLESVSENARRAYEQLGPRPVALAEICGKSGLSSGEAMAALTELELAGLSRQLAGRQFVMVS